MLRQRWSGVVGVSTGSVRSRSILASMLVLTACPGGPPPLPELEGDESSGTDEEFTTEESSTTEQTELESGPATGSPECGNGNAEKGEDCDGAAWDGATCESLGYEEGILACVACRFDTSSCGAPLGMVLVPAGGFQMGPGGAEAPVWLDVDAFWIDVTEVTVEAYEACVVAGRCAVPSMEDAEGSSGFNYYEDGHEQHPVNGVSWFDAMAYCEWVDGGVKRLPTEAEWEKAARGTDGRRYPWGSQLPSCSLTVMEGSNGDGCGDETTGPVGSKPLGISPYGALDMSGNLWEWVYDLHDPDDPVDPHGQGIHVRRGGSWSVANELYFRADYRGSDLESNRPKDVGFRCARTPLEVR